MAIVTVTLAVMLLSLVQSIDCDCNKQYIVLRDDDFFITSPNYPGNFTQFADCYYELSTTSLDMGTVVIVEVVDISIDCNDTLSQLKVYDGFSRNPRYLGQVCKGGEMTFESPKHTLYFTFRTHALIRSRGFRLRVRAEQKFTHCYTQTTKILDVTASPAVLTSPFFPYETDANVNCRWLLKAPDGSAVNATLLAVDMRGSRQCNNFGLYVYDGKTTYDDRLMAAVCDNSQDRSFQSSGSYLLVVFTSGSLVFHSGGGIKLQYSVMPLDREEERVIGQNMFSIIIALLLTIIIAVATVAALKLFLLPKRRKEAERRRREARARLTRMVSTTDSQSDLLPPSPTASELSYISSCTSLSSYESSPYNGVDRGSSCQSSESSATRLLVRYGLKKAKRGRGRMDRCDTVRECGYHGDSGGVVMGLPGLPPFQGACAVLYELPPSYEEAMAHPTSNVADLSVCLN